jgi:hypothetical protein
MNSQRNTAKIIGNKTDLMLLLFSFTPRTLLLLVQILAAMMLFVVCILNICYMLCSVSLVNWMTCKQIAEIEKKVDVMLLKGNDNNNNHDTPSLNGISLQNGKGGNGNNGNSDGRRRRIEQ